MKKLSKTSRERLEIWINNVLFKTLREEDWEIESILYIVRHEEVSSL